MFVLHTSPSPNESSIYHRYKVYTVDWFLSWKQEQQLSLFIPSIGLTGRKKPLLLGALQVLLRLDCLLLIKLLL